MTCINKKKNQSTNWKANAWNVKRCSIEDSFIVLGYLTKPTIHKSIQKCKFIEYALLGTWFDVYALL